jgi:hypothetical protein
MYFYSILPFLTILIIFLILLFNHLEKGDLGLPYLPNYKPYD